MRLNPYLAFNGNCEDAFRFYETVFGGKINEFMRFAGTEAEAHVALEWKDKVMHVALTIGDQVLMGSDGPTPGTNPEQGMSVVLHYDDIDEAEKVFNALGEGGSIRMPLQQTFWAKRFGMVSDRFGTPWLVNVAPDAP